MQRGSRVTALCTVMLLGILLGAWSVPAVLAQEATPGAEGFTEEGVSFEPLAAAMGLALPSTGELFVSRVSFEPGAGFPIEEGDPTYALAVIESGELTIRQEGPLVVTRAGALETAFGEAEAGGAFAPETETIAAGQEVTVQAGDAVLFPPNVGGEIRNDGQERTDVLVVFVGPPTAEGTPAAGTPAP